MKNNYFKKYNSSIAIHLKYKKWGFCSAAFACKSGAGFTLIETIIYMALFVIVIGGGITTAYQIIQSTDASYNHVILQEEANFLFRKINWALTGAITASANSSTLAVSKPIFGVLTPLTFTLNGNGLTLKRGTGLAVILNSSSIAVLAVSFVKTAGTNGKPDSIESNFTLVASQNGRPATQNFSFTKYLRK